MSSTTPDAAAPASTAPPKPTRSGVPFWAQVFIGLAVGVVLGFVARQFEQTWLAETLKTVGGIFVQLLKVIVVPLVLTAIIVSIANLRQVTNAARLAGETLVWFAITAAASVVVGITLGLITNPGAHATLDTSAGKAPGHTGSWLDFLTSIVPGNFLGLEVSTSADEAGALSSSPDFNILQLVVLGLAIGAAALSVGAKAEPFVNLTRSALEVFSKLVWWVIKLSPLGTAALIGSAVANYGWDLLAPLAIFTADVYIGCFIVLLVIYPIVARANGLSIAKFYAGAWPAIQFAFVSRSSIGTLPLTQRVVTHNLGVSRDYASFAVPIGATTKMDGCAAIYPALAAITVAQLFGVDLGLTDYLLIAFVSIVGSAATAGLTGAIVMLTLTLSTLGLPLEGVGLLLAIDPIIDMIRTATNVAGQALVPTIVAKRNGLLDEATYDSNTFGGADVRLQLDEDETSVPAPAHDETRVAVPA
ncbi:dicarboxylate/amino acid:cation symporter [Knoellia sp. Soil729]|uniref:dicarboxylate/amino acid:cation symporter n=1 Tax=Knoellia sp. Soil729 TaxID=1736394 RepID=UPI0006F94EEB|nr:dicarboxylate/amino acid:cation symporter [Knoellia sp. Soil729]KRE41586.1 sodium:proton antiporter [Knoellia sp. Soil729]